MLNVIYIFAAGAIGVFLGMIVELIAEKPYIDELEKKVEGKPDIEVIEINDDVIVGKAEIVSEEPEDLFQPF